MVAANSRAVLSGAHGFCWFGPRSRMRRSAFAEGLSAGAGGWLHCDLPSRSRAHLCRSHVPAVQSSKACAIVRSAGTKKGAGTKRAYFASIFARKIGLVSCSCFGPALIKFLDPMRCQPGWLPRHADRQPIRPLAFDRQGREFGAGGTESAPSL